jgi:hypothetical protein
MKNKPVKKDRECQHFFKILDIQKSANSTRLFNGDYFKVCSFQS